MKNVQEERGKESLDERKRFLPPPANPMGKEYESSDSLKQYVQNLGACARKKRRRCISQELGKVE